MDKYKELTKIKNIILALLIIDFLLFCLSIYFNCRPLQIFTEAVLVGGIADWFAVVALFRRPLGFKIPHTAIIPNNKNKIAKNLAIFVKSEFLNKDSLKDSEVINRIDIKKITVAFLNGKYGSFSFDASLNKFNADIFPKIYLSLKNSNDLASILKVDKIDFVSLISNGYFTLRNNKYFDEIFDEVLDIVIKQTKTNSSFLQEKLKGDSFLNKLVSSITDYDTKVINGIIDFCEKLKNKNSKERLNIIKKVDEYIKNLSNEKEKINLKIISVIDSELIKKIINIAVEYIEENKEDVGEMIKRKTRAYLDDFLTKDKKINAINKYTKTKAVNILNDYSEEIVQYIESVVNKWDSIEISNKLELEIGKDLQWIRVSGMTMGGVIGLMIYLFETIMAMIIN